MATLLHSLRDRRAESRDRWRRLRNAATIDRLLFPPPASAFAHFGARSVIAPHARVQRPDRIHIGDDVVIHEHCWLSLVEFFEGRPPVLRIGNRVRMGRGCQVSVCGEIDIEDDVLISDAVHIGDTYHRYDVLGLTAKQQPMSEPEPVRVKRGALINLGAIVLHGVTIGQNAYVHARSVVTRDVPDGAVVIGNPARVVERGSAPWV